jgi:hypothetical protein
MATVWKVQGLYVSVLDQGEGTVIAHWQFNTGSTTDHFSVFWEYWNTTNKMWVLASESGQNVPTTSYEGKWFQTTWSPNGAAETSPKVRIYVNPIPKSGSSWKHAGVYSKDIVNPKWTNLHGEALEAPDFDCDWYGEMVRMNATDAPTLSKYIVFYQSVDGGSANRLRETTPNVPVSVTPAEGHFYQFAARWMLEDRKTMGEMSLLTDDIFYGRPMRPTNLTAMVVSCDSESGSVRLDWNDHGNVGDKYLVEWSTDPEAWDNHAEVESDEAEGQPDSSGKGWRTIGGLDPGVTYWLRVRRGESKAEDFYEWSDYACVGSNSTVLQVSCVMGTRPTSPTLGQVPASVPVDSPLTLSWTHNSEDGSAQTAYEAQAMRNGSWVALSSGTTSQTLTFTPSEFGLADGSTLQWRVRTKGALDTGSANDWSPWSATGSVMVWAKPSATITVPATVSSLPLVVSLSVGATSEGNRPTRYWMQVVADEPYTAVGADGEDEWVALGQSVWSGEAVPGDDGCTVSGWSVSLTPADIRLAQGISYQVSGGCYTSQGLRSEATAATFVADISRGNVDGCDATVTFDRETMSATIRPTCTDGPDGDLVMGVTLSVWRMDPDSSVLVADGLANDGLAVCADPHPTFGECVYRVVATDGSTGAQGSADVTLSTRAPGIVIQWDEEWGMPSNDSDGVSFSGKRLVLPFDVDVSEQWSKQSSLNEWAGRRSPVSRYGTQQGRTATWTCDINRHDGLDQVNAVRKLATHMGDVYVREPYGSGYWAHVDVSSLDMTHAEAAVRVTLNVTKVEG